MSHEKVVCSKCRTVVRQCRCFDHNKKVVYEDGCEKCAKFLHKESGSFIKWYKYIGRDMEVTLLTNWDLIITDCLNSLESAFES